VIGKLLGADANLPGIETLLMDEEFDGYLDLTWPESLARAAITTALRHVELGRNIVEIQRTILTQSRNETAAWRELAGHDELTHLFNRRHFSEAVAREHDRSRRREHPYALVFIDLDNLKQLNTRWGHAGGSKALRELAGLLMASVRTSDMAARMGGDEFVVFLDDCDANGALEFANRLCQTVREHAFDVDGVAVPISVSAGVAAYPRHGQDYAELLQCADVALYEAKALGKGCAVAFGHAARPPSALLSGRSSDVP
jgi:diguanylate cyclase (GGDEF)-like protein